MINENNNVNLEEKEDIIIPELKKFIPNADGKPKHLKVSVESKQSTFLSALPEATQLEMYEKFSPGITDRMMSLVEKNILHDHIMSEKYVEKVFEDQKYSKKCAVICVIAGLAAGVICTILGHYATGITVGLAPSVMNAIAQFLRRDKRK